MKRTYIKNARIVNETYGSFFNSTIGGSFFHCPFLLDLFISDGLSFYV